MLAFFFIFFIGDRMRRFYSFINRLLITGLFTIICLIGFRKSSSFKGYFFDNFLSYNFSFASINDLYRRYFGDIFPFSSFFERTSTVFNESSLEYYDFHDYLDGVSLSVGDDYMVPVIFDGLVVFVGDKEGYGKTVIIQDSNGIDVWYSNLSNVSVKLYEYLSSGSFVGSCNNDLYLVFKKDGRVLDFKEFI